MSNICTLQDRLDRVAETHPTKSSAREGYYTALIRADRHLDLVAEALACGVGRTDDDDTGDLVVDLPIDDE